jgi:branched-chain amino acid transport system permease protein
VPSFTGDMPFDIFGVSILPQEMWLIGALIIITLAIGFFFRRTILGLALRAGATNPLGASFVGIDPRILGLTAFAASGFLGALAGAIWSPISFAQVDVGLGVALKGFTAAILGGLHSNYGPILGGIVLALIESFSAGYISSAYMDSITFGLMLVMLVLRPQGLLGSALSLTKDERPEETLSTSARPTGFTTRDVAVLAILVIALIGLGLVMNGTWLTSGIFAGIMAIVVMGLVLLTGYGGQLSLGQGAFMMIGAYATGYLTVKQNWPSYGAMLVGVVLAAGVAFILGRLIFVLRGLYMSMASFGLLMISLTFAREWTDITGGPSGLPGISPLSIGGFVFTSDRANYFLIAGCSLLALLFCLSLARSRLGRALLAIRSNEPAARACGVDVTKHKLRVFAVSAALASIAGSLYGHYLGFVNPLPFGIDATIAQLTALTAGGFLSLSGAYVGSAVVIALPLVITKIAGTTSSQFSAGVQYVAFGVLLIGIVHIQTNGLSVRLSTALRRLLPFGASAPVLLAKKEPP